MLTNIQFRFGAETLHLDDLVFEAILEFQAHGGPRRRAAMRIVNDYSQCIRTVREVAEVILARWPGLVAEAEQKDRLLQAA